MPVDFTDFCEIYLFYGANNEIGHRMCVWMNRFLSAGYFREGRFGAASAGALVRVCLPRASQANSEPRQEFQTADIVSFEGRGHKLKLFCWLRSPLGHVHRRDAEAVE